MHDRSSYTRASESIGAALMLQSTNVFLTCDLTLHDVPSTGLFVAHKLAQVTKVASRAALTFFEVGLSSREEGGHHNGSSKHCSRHRSTLTDYSAKPEHTAPV